MNTVLRFVGQGDGTALDAGMGPGRLALELARRGWEVSGLDSAAEMVALASARMPDASDRFSVGDIENLPFPAESFDGVVATGVLEYSSLERALGEVARVLKPGGRAVVSYPNPVAVYAIWKTKLFYPLVRAAKGVITRRRLQLPRGAPAQKPKQFEAVLTRAGLAPVARVYTSFLPTISPLDELAPTLSMKVGERLEGSGGDRLGRLFAIQVVFAARKPETPPLPQQ